jgi:hypothetical protein
MRATAVILCAAVLPCLLAREQARGSGGREAAAEPADGAQQHGGALAAVALSLDSIAVAPVMAATAAPLVLPRRDGVKPRTSSGLPHMQLEQQAPLTLQRRLVALGAALPHVTLEHTHISMPTPEPSAFCLDPSARTLRPERLMVPSAGEFAHVHTASDGGLHLVLSPADYEVAVAAGWVENHPMAGARLPWGRAPATLVLVYGPRTEAELAHVWAIVQRAYAYATGGMD